MKINKILAVGLVGALALSVGGVCQPLDKALAQTSKEDRSALLPPQNQPASTSPEDLKKEKKNAKKQLSKLKNLGKEKGEYRSRIEKASSKKEIDEIIKEAQIKDAEILKTTKEESIKEIENDTDLDSNEKGILLEKIKKAETKSGIESIKIFSLPIAKELSKATNLSDNQKKLLREYNGKHSEEHYKKIQKLNEKVGQAKEEIQDLKNIDEKKKQEYINQIDGTIEKDEIDKIVGKAKAEKGKEDTVEAKEAEDLVQKAEEAYKKAKEEIDNAGNVISQEKLNELTNKVEEAKKEKETAQKAVEKLPDSVKDKKDSLNQRITKLTEPALPAVNDTNNNGKDDKEEAKEEKEKARKEIEEDYNKKVEEIDQAKNSTKEEKEEAKTKARAEADKAKEAIDKAETNDKVTEAKTAGETEINKINPEEKTKPKARKEIEESNLSEKDKEKYLKQIQNAKTQIEIEKILRKALKEEQKADKKTNNNKEVKQNPAKLASTGLSTQSSTFIATILAMIAIFLRRRNK